MTKEYYQVDAINIAKNWPLVETLIEKAMVKSGNTDFTIEGCFNRLLYNHWQLFVLLDNKEINTMVVTSVVPYDTCTYLNPVFISAVDDKKKVDLDYLQKCLEEIAKNFNCNKIMGGGRVGWQRTLSKLGYKEYNLMVKEL